MTNNAGATIGSSSTGGDGILTGGDSGATTVTNHGEIYGVNVWAVSLAGDGTVANYDVIQGAGGVSIGGVGEMVTNDKTITATASIGVSIGDGGTVVNASDASITGASEGVSISSASGTTQGTVTNSGSIVATDQDGTAAYLEDGGAVTNNAGATIGSSTTGGDGILTGGDTGATTLTNYGTITGKGGDGVSLAGPAVIDNYGNIYGDAALDLPGGGHVLNMGNINGGVGALKCMAPARSSTSAQSLEPRAKASSSTVPARWPTHAQSDHRHDRRRQRGGAARGRRRQCRRDHGRPAPAAVASNMTPTAGRWPIAGRSPVSATASIPMA